MAENSGRTMVVEGGQLKLVVNGAKALPIGESRRVPRVGVYCDTVGEVVAVEGCGGCSAEICLVREKYGLGPRVRGKQEILT